MKTFGTLLLQLITMDRSHCSLSRFYGGRYRAHAVAGREIHAESSEHNRDRRSRKSQNIAGSVVKVRFIRLPLYEIGGRHNSVGARNNYRLQTPGARG